MRAASAAIRLALIAGLAACESEITNPGDEVTEGELVLDASSAATWVYASLADGGAVVTPADPSTSTEWHIAFRRYSAKLNGGVAGPGDVAGYNVRNHAAATGPAVAAFTMADADAAWEAVSAADIATAVFEEDDIVEDANGSWFRFDAAAGSLVANPVVAWKVDESGSGFAAFRVSNLTLGPGPDFEPESVTLQFRHQPAGGSLGPMGGVTIDLAAGDGYVDFASGAVVTPSGCNWDILFTQDLEVELNAACGAGTFPLDSSEDFTTLTSAANAPSYGGFLAVLSGAFPNSVGDASGLFWYNLEGNNRLSPTFNVFLVRVGADVYKVQVLDYYSSTGASGFPTIRFMLLQ